MLATRRALHALLFATVAFAPRSQESDRMDFGPCLMGSFDIRGTGGDNTALKGLAIRVGPKREATLLFDTELLRMAAGWTGGFVVFRGTPHDGAHGPIPYQYGDLAFWTPQAPGIAKAGSFADPRSIPHGPLPHDHGRYLGHYRGKEGVVLHYRVGAREVLELPGMASGDAGVRALTRSFDIAAGEQPISMVIAQRRGAHGWVGTTTDDVQKAQLSGPAAGHLALLMRTTPADKPEFAVRRAGGAWSDLPFGGPTAKDFAQADGQQVVEVQVVDGFAGVATKGDSAKALGRLFDGQAADHDNDLAKSVWFKNGATRLLIDLQAEVDLHALHVFTRQRRARAQQNYVLWGRSDLPEGSEAVDRKQLKSSGWQRLGRGDSRRLGYGGKHMTAIAGADGAPLGNVRYLLMDIQKTNAPCFFSEIDIFAGDVQRPENKAADAMVTAAWLAEAPEGAEFTVDDQQRMVLTLPKSSTPQRCKLLMFDGRIERLSDFVKVAQLETAGELKPMLEPKAPEFGEELVTKGSVSSATNGYVVDTITVPQKNPWQSRLRFGAFDFFSDGRAALSTWNGDVWVVSGIDGDLDELKWRRFATGLFDPLGLRIVDDVIHTHGRDGITKLLDRNGDGEADHYICFNNDVYITRSFHEFAFDLQTDAEGNFYFSKGGPVKPGGRGFDKLVPHHGTLMKVSKDGKKLEVVATGLRAPNGIGVGPNGELTSGDNEGTWTPRCRLNWIKPGSFLGCVDTAHRDERPSEYDLPICWFPMEVDNSSGNQVWVPPGDRFGPMGGELLHLSYGQCNTYRVLRQEFADGVVQGGVVKLPVSFASSCMRGRFSPRDGQLYVCGFRGWQTRAATMTAFQRVRFAGGAARMPSGLTVYRDGVEVRFTDPVDPELGADPESYTVETWNYLWTQNYGSPEVSTVDPEKDMPKVKGNWNGYKRHDQVKVTEVRLAADGKSAFLVMPGLSPVMQMKIAMDLEAADGSPMEHVIYNAIHRVPEMAGPTYGTK